MRWAQECRTGSSRGAASAPCVWGVCERAGLHAREPGQLRFDCVSRPRYRESTATRDLSWSPRRSESLGAWWSSFACDCLWFCRCALWTVCSLARIPISPWRLLFGESATRSFAFNSWGRVVFVSVYALGVYTSASGLWHFLDYLNI